MQPFIPHFLLDIPLVRQVTIGSYVVGRYRRRAREVGHYKVALQLKKQGIPLEIARLILL